MSPSKKSSHTITPLWHQMSPSQCNLQMKNWTLYEIRNNITQRINVVHIENFILWTNHDKFDHWALALWSYFPTPEFEILYSYIPYLICLPQELRSANHHLEIVNSSIYISPYWSPHHPQKSHWQESGLEMENYLRIYCFHRSSLPLDGVTMNVRWRNRIGTYSHYLCSIALTSSSSLEAEYRIRSERN